MEEEEFTEARLETVLADGHGLPVDVVLTNVTSAVVEFVGEAEQSDDITCIVLRYDGNESEEGAA